jgi:hypothetical protein
MACEFQIIQKSGQGALLLRAIIFLRFWENIFDI